MILTTREAAVLDGIAEGLTDAEIGAELFLSRETIKDYVKRVREKFGARNRAHAVALAYHLGVLRSPKEAQ